MGSVVLENLATKRSFVLMNLLGNFVLPAMGNWNHMSKNIDNDVEELMLFLCMQCVE